jgi:hypothetical protein
MPRRNRTRRRKTRTQEITRKPARKTFLGYRTYFGKARHVISEKRPAFRYTTTKRNTRSVSRALHSRRLRSSHSLSGPSFTKLKVRPRTTLKKELICKNRRLRREVIFALNKNGLSGQKKPIRRNPDVTCRR